MKKIIMFVLFAGFAFVSGLHAADVNQSILKQIAVIEKDPLGKEADAAYREILKFATDSSDVDVTLTADVMPWINEDSKYKPKLIGAFIAGNIQPQIKSKIKEDNPYEALIFVFGVYEKIKKADPAFSSDGIEYLMSLHKKNKLKEHLAAVKK